MSELKLLQECVCVCVRVACVCVCACVVNMKYSLCSQITQIGLSAYQILCVAVFLAKDLSNVGSDIPYFVSTLLVSTWTHTSK